MKTQFTSPVGRIVQGDAFEPQLKDQQGAPRVVKTGPNAGQPSPQWFIALAYPKGAPETNAHLMEILTASAAAWPSLFPAGVNPALPNFGCVLPTFSSKIIDGDGYDTTGKSNATKEGFAGHWVVRYSSGFAPKCYPAGHYGPADMITDPKLLRRGYYARVAGTLEGNENPTKPGMYVNLSLVELAGHGPEIVSGPDAAAAFGSGPASLPPGASVTPLAVTTALPGGAPPAPPPAAYVAPPAAPAAPYAGYMAPPVAAAPPAAPPAPPGRTMLPAAGGVTYEAMIAAGWTDATLVAHGMMAA